MVASVIGVYLQCPWTLLSTLDLCVGIGAPIITYLLCNQKYISESLWSTKTIVLDWLIVTVLIIVATCVDIIYETRYLGLAFAYFCSANIISVVVIKLAEMVLKRRSPTPPCPRGKFIHNLVVSRTVLPSLHVGQLLVVSWALTFILLHRMEFFYQDIPTWHFMIVTGLAGSLFLYMFPIVADKNPQTYYTPQELAVKRQQS